MHKFFKNIYYNPLHVHVSKNILLILRRSNCIKEHLVSSLSVSDRPVHRLIKNYRTALLSQPVHWTVTYWQWRYQMLY